MKSSTKELILKIVGYLLFVMVILILVKYIMVLHNKKNNNHSSQTINTVEENNQIIHTPINNNLVVKSIEEEKEKLIANIAEKIKSEMQENFSTDTVCLNDPTKSIYYLYLQVQLLESAKFKPEPIWTNELFCLYKVQPIISIDSSLAAFSTIEKDFYYPLGDILLFKDYRKYMADYQNLLTAFNEARALKTCEPESNNTESNNTESNNNTGAPSVQVAGEHNNEGFVGEVTGAPGIFPPPDVHITNYDQPGLKGLQVLVKNGKKPTGFESEPVAVINGTNGENLYFWRPLAPEGYVFLGDMISMGATPNMPMVDSCNIRCIPQECVNNVNLQVNSLVASKDINRPYTVMTVANGKYFKGFIDNGIASTSIVSNDLNQKCLNVERDDNDTETKLDIVMNATDGSGNPPAKELIEVVFNTIVGDYLVEIEKHIVLNEELNLNNVLNNSNIDGSIYRKENMRFRLETKFLLPNKFTLSIILKKRAIAYGEPRTDELTQIMKDKLNEIFTYNFRGMGYDFTFIPENIRQISMGMSPAEKEVLVELEKAIQELEKQVQLEKEKKILPQNILDSLDLLVTKLKSLVDAMVNSLVTKESLVKECQDKVSEIYSLISGYEVPDLKKVLDELITILAKLKTVLENMGAELALNLDPTFNIDSKLKDELESLGKLAIRNAGAPAGLDDFFSYHPQGLTRNLSISSLE